MQTIRRNRWWMLLALGVLAVLGTVGALLVSGASEAASKAAGPDPAVSSSVPSLDQPLISVGPQSSTIVQEVYDSDSQGLGGPTDMAGPQEGVNAVRYVQGADSRLVFTFTIPYGHPSATYNVFLTCGPSHATACGFVNVGQILTNASGVGSRTFTVLCRTLLALHPNGYKTDHIDTGNTAAPSEFLVAGAINYFQACPATATSGVSVTAGDPA